ncbi:MAG: aminopeptidase P family protein [Propionibacteriaceae bacterium]|jgi:Xaa-Pro aminopeptidase|nr:aminopeptidase P family protein [Propionibacteriaceae bacterium]
MTKKSSNRLPNRMVPYSEAFTQFIPEQWAPYPAQWREPNGAMAYTPARRETIMTKFPNDRLVIPAGGYHVRSNDCDFRFRPHSAFAHLTGLGEDFEPDAALVLENGEATLYFHGRVARTDPEFYSSAQYGEMWVGPRPSLDEMAHYTQLTVMDSAELAPRLASPLTCGGITRIIAGVDPRLDALVTALRGSNTEADHELTVALSELRLRKDEYEIEQMEAACAATLTGFEAVIAELPEAVRRGRGERWVEGVFGLHARHLGNALGYDTIAAGGDHACTLHWIRNDGDLKPSDLLLLDAGVEVDSLYTADITRTLPVGGRFSPAQRQVYDAVLEAQQAGINAARPGANFIDVHRAAVKVLATKLHEWGILPVSVEETLSSEGGQFRRWMVHGTSHHLGIDVHDCAQARQKHYRAGKLKPGMVITVEPGLYFKSTDLMVPEELRGIGVRIEDDILITDDEARVLSEAFPRDPEAVEAWISEVQSR